jgi:hypothetical protein
MKKLVSMYHDNFGYHTRIHDELRDKYENITFMYYSKKEVIRRLRSKYHCSVSHKFY